MRKIAMLLFAAVAVSARAADTRVKGYLVDLECARDQAQQPNFGITHTKMCLQLPDCARGGYGVLTTEKKVIHFDKAGNEAAGKFISTVLKTSDIKVTVTGTVNGEEMTVSKIELQ